MISTRPWSGHCNDWDQKCHQSVVCQRSWIVAPDEGMVEAAAVAVQIHADVGEVVEAEADSADVVEDADTAADSSGFHCEFLGDAADGWGDSCLAELDDDTLLEAGVVQGQPWADDEEVLLDFDVDVEALDETAAPKMVLHWEWAPEAQGPEPSRVWQTSIEKEQTCPRCHEQTSKHFYERFRSA